MKKRCFCYRRMDGTICVDPECERDHKFVPPLGWMGNAWYRVTLVLALLLLAAPLSAQQTVVVPDVTVEVENVIDSIAVYLTVEVPPPDSAQAAAALRAQEAIADYFATCGCTEGRSTLSQFSTAGLTLAAFLIAWQLKRIADRPANNTTVNVENHEHKDHGEGDGHR